MTDDIPARGFDRGDSALRGEAGSRRETPHITDPPEDLGRQNGTDTEQVRESSVGLVDGRGNLFVNARHHGVEPTYVVEQVHREQPTSSGWTGRNPDMAQQRSGSVRRQRGGYLTGCQLGQQAVQTIEGLCSRGDQFVASIG